MKLSISNLAFKDFDFLSSLKVVRDLGIEGLELAPTVLWPRPELTSREERGELRRKIADAGLQVSALQSLFFGCPEANCFGSQAAQALFEDHFRKMIDLGVDLGAETLCFGSYRNRVRGSLLVEKARDSFVSLMRPLGQYAEQQGIRIGLEAIPKNYGCDFLNTNEEAAEVVRSIDRPGIGLLLDTGNMLLNSEDFRHEIPRHLGLMIHFQVNDPMLAIPSDTHIDHREVRDQLLQCGYKGWVSFEYLSSRPLLETLAYGIRAYGS